MQGRGAETICPTTISCGHVVGREGAGKVGVDCYVKIGKALYSVPWRLMGQQVHARSAGDSVQVMH